MEVVPKLPPATVPDEQRRTSPTPMTGIIGRSRDRPWDAWPS